MFSSFLLGIRSIPGSNWIFNHSSMLGIYPRVSCHLDWRIYSDHIARLVSNGFFWSKGAVVQIHSGIPTDLHSSSYPTEETPSSRSYPKSHSFSHESKSVTTCDGWNRQRCHYCWRRSGQTVHLTLHFAFTRKQNPEMCSLWFLSKLLSRVTDGAIHSSLAGNHGVRHGGADSSQPLRAWLTLPRCRPRVWRTRWTGQISLCFILCCCFHIDLTVLDHNSHLYTLVYL